MVDLLNFDNIVPFYYVTFALTLGLAIKLLIQSTGNSLIAIFVICVSLQAGSAYYYLPSYVADSSSKIDPSAFTKFGIGFIVFFITASLAMTIQIFTLKKRGTSEQPQSRQTGLSPAILGLVIAASCIYIAARLQTGSANLVLSQGMGVMGGEAYYDIRGELIELDLRGYSRLMGHFENITRKLMYLFLICFSYRTAFKHSLNNVLGLGFFASLLFFDEAIRFQKAPIMLVIASLSIPYLIGRTTERSKLHRGFALIAAFIIISVVSAATVVFTMGKPVNEVFWFITERFFLVPSYTGAMHFYVYPDLNPHVHFTNLRMVGWLLGTGPLTYSGLVSIDVAEAVTNNRFNANTSIVGDAYANWGYTGIIIATIFITFLFGFIDRYVSKWRNNIDVTPLVLFYWSCFVSFGNSSLVNVIMTNSLWFIPLAYRYFFVSLPPAEDPNPSVIHKLFPAPNNSTSPT